MPQEQIDKLTNRLKYTFSTIDKLFNTPPIYYETYDKDSKISIKIFKEDDHWSTPSIENNIKIHHSDTNMFVKTKFSIGEKRNDTNGMEHDTHYPAFSGGVIDLYKYKDMSTYSIKDLNITAYDLSIFEEPLTPHNIKVKFTYLNKVFDDLDNVLKDKIESNNDLIKKAINSIEKEIGLYVG